MANDAPISEDEQKPAGRGKIVMIGVVAAVLIIEGIVVFMVGKSMRPAPAEATDEVEASVSLEGDKFSEIKLVETFSVDNYMQGRIRTIIKLDVVIRVETGEEEAFKKLEEYVADHLMQIQDSIRQCVASAEPAIFKDPPLTTLKRQMKSGLEKILGENSINEIYITNWSKFDTE